MQVPMSKALREEAVKVAKDYGFSSLQEVIRLLVAKLSRRELTINVHADEEVTYLSKRAEKRYAKAKADIEAGRNITKTKNVDELLTLLRS